MDNLPTGTTLHKIRVPCLVVIIASSLTWTVLCVPVLGAGIYIC